MELVSGYTDEFQMIIGRGHELANFLDSEEAKTMDLEAERGIVWHNEGGDPGTTFRYYHMRCKGGTSVSLNFMNQRISTVSISPTVGQEGNVTSDINRLFGN